MPKQNPYFPKLPETATVSYYNPETDQNLTAEEWNELNSVANPSEIRIINKDGTYYSWKAGIDYPPYGPGLFDYLGAITGATVKGTAKTIDDSPIAKFGAKVAITTTAGLILGPAAIPVGAAVWGVSKGAEKLAEMDGNDDAKKLFSFVSDIGRDTLIGGAIGVAVQGVGAAAGVSGKIGLGSNVGSSAARKAAEEYFIVDGIKFFASPEKARAIAVARHGAKVFGQIEFWIGKGFDLADATKHVLHKFDGISYDSDCKVCRS